MKKMINKSHIEGLLYQHNLEKKVSGPNSTKPGTEYITGSIDIATDNNITNIVKVYYTYVTEFTGNGKQNPSYATLLNIINETTCSVMKHGADKAAKLRIDSAIGLNEFYSDQNGKEEFVSVKRNVGGFIHLVNALDENEDMRNTFEVDMIITNVSHVEGDPDKGTKDKAIVKGAIFDFRNALLPVELSATHPDAINYFEGLEASAKEPAFTRVKGKQISETVVKTITEDSAFGTPHVREVKNSYKDFVITWAQADLYDWDDEGTILVKELTEAMANRETYLATLKKRNDEYKASKTTATKTATTNAAPAPGAFNF